MKLDEITRVFLHKRPVEILMAMEDPENKYPSILAKKVDCTYTHVLKLLKVFEKYGMVEFKKEGRVKYTKLTDTGKSITSQLKSFIKAASEAKKK